MSKIERLEHIRELSNIDISSPSRVGKRKTQKNQEIKYDFTYNNYKYEDLERLECFFKGICKKFIFQEEIGKTGTPHLQGGIWLKKRSRMTELVKYDELKHMSFRPLVHSWSSLVKYCQKTIDEKPGGRLPGGKIFRYNVFKTRKAIRVLKEEQLYPWQVEINTILQREADDRSIRWFWSREGGIGKSTFAKYLVIKSHAIVLSGSASDMKYGITKFIERHGDYPELIIIDIPRTYEKFVSYNGIEQIKNALFFSTKYESDMVIGNPPHVLCFANFEPDFEAMSLDRWIVKNIGKIEVDEWSDTSINTSTY